MRFIPWQHYTAWITPAENRLASAPRVTSQEHARQELQVGFQDGQEEDQEEDQGILVQVTLVPQIAIAHLNVPVVVLVTNNRKKVSSPYGELT